MFYGLPCILKRVEMVNGKFSIERERESRISPEEKRLTMGKKIEWNAQNKNVRNTETSIKTDEFTVIMLLCMIHTFYFGGGLFRSPLKYRIHASCYQRHIVTRLVSCFAVQTTVTPFVNNICALRFMFSFFIFCCF